VWTHPPDAQFDCWCGKFPLQLSGQSTGHRVLSTASGCPGLNRAWVKLHLIWLHDEERLALRLCLLRGNFWVEAIAKVMGRAHLAILLSRLSRWAPSKLEVLRRAMWGNKVRKHSNVNNVGPLSFFGSIVLPQGQLRFGYWQAPHGIHEWSAISRVFSCVLSAGFCPWELLLWCHFVELWTQSVQR